MDFLKYALAIVLWAVFYFFVGLALAFGAKLGWEGAQTIITKMRNRTPKEAKIKGGKGQHNNTVGPAGEAVPTQRVVSPGGNGNKPAPQPVAAGG